MDLTFPCVFVISWLSEMHIYCPCFESNVLEPIAFIEEPSTTPSVTHSAFTPVSRTTESYRRGPAHGSSGPAKSTSAVQLEACHRVVMTRELSIMMLLGNKQLKLQRQQEARFPNVQEAGYGKHHPFVISVSAAISRCGYLRHSADLRLPRTCFWRCASVSHARHLSAQARYQRCRVDPPSRYHTDDLLYSPAYSGLFAAGSVRQYAVIQWVR